MILVSNSNTKFGELHPRVCTTQVYNYKLQSLLYRREAINTILTREKTHLI